MTFDITNPSVFTVCRTNAKTGATQYRGALGVISSGNKAERTELTAVALCRMVDNCNFYPILRELGRVFSPKWLEAQLKNDTCLFVRDEQLYLETSHNTFTALDMVKADKATFLTIAKAILLACERYESTKAGREIKGERATYRTALKRAEANAVAAIAASKAEETATETEQA